MDKWPLALIVLSAAIGSLPTSVGQVNPVVGEPAPVSAVFDGTGGFRALDGARDVEVFSMDDKTYAVVVAWSDDGVQIMDITDPAQPAPASAVFDGTGGFTALAGPEDAEVFSMDDKTYAAVAAGYDDGVQIMDVTDPTNPVPVSVVFDDVGGFTALAGPEDVEVFSMNGKTYGIVAAAGDNGVQVMDITDPASPVPVSVVFDDSEWSNPLTDAYDVEVFSTHGRTYGIVAAFAYGVVQIIDITDIARPAPVSTVFDNSEGFSALAGATDVEVFGIDGRIYGMVAGFADGGVQIMDVTDPAHPAPVSAVFDGSGGFGALNMAAGVEVFSMHGRTYGVVAAMADGGVQIMDVTDPAHPAPVSAVFDGSGGFGALNGAADVEVFSMHGKMYGMVADFHDGGVQIMEVTDPAHPAPVSAAFDGTGGFGALNGANGVEVFNMHGRTYGIAAARIDNGVQIMDVTDPVNPAPVSAVFDGIGGFSTLAGASDVEVYEADGRTYGIVAGFADGGVQIMDVTDPANPAPVSAAFDGIGGFSTLAGASDVEVFNMHGRTYGIATSWHDGGAQIMDITDPTYPIPVSAVLGGFGGFGPLAGTSDVEVFSAYGRTFGIVTTAYDYGVWVMDMTDPARPVPVSAIFDGTDGLNALYGAGDVEVFSMDGRTYGIVTAMGDFGTVRIIDITDPAYPIPVSTIFDDAEGFSALERAGDVEVYEIGGRTYGVVTAEGDDGVQVMDLTDPANPAPVSAVFDGAGGFDALDRATDVEVFSMGSRTYGIVAAEDDSGVQVMDMTPSFPHRLDASIMVAGHERIPHGNNDFVQISIEITNHGTATLANDNQDGTTSSGELHVSLNAVGKSHAYGVQPCDAALDSCAWSNGEYVAYDGVTREQAEAYGITVSEDDCTAWDDWSVRSGETAEVKFCYWVDAEFQPESMQFYQTGEGRVQSIPFVEHGSCYLPYMLCNESSLTPLH